MHQTTQQLMNSGKVCYDYSVFLSTAFLNEIYCSIYFKGTLSFSPFGTRTHTHSHKYIIHRYTQTLTHTYTHKFTHCKMSSRVSIRLVCFVAVVRLSLTVWQGKRLNSSCLPGQTVKLSRITATKIFLTLRCFY